MQQRHNPVAVFWGGLHVIAFLNMIPAAFLEQISFSRQIERASGVPAYLQVWIIEIVLIVLLIIFARIRYSRSPAGRQQKEDKKRQKEYKRFCKEVIKEWKDEGLPKPSKIFLRLGFEAKLASESMGYQTSLS